MLKIVESTGTTTIFTKELISPETAQAVAAETGAQTRVLSPIKSTSNKAFAVEIGIGDSHKQTIDNESVNLKQLYAKLTQK